MQRRYHLRRRDAPVCSVDWALRLEGDRARALACSAQAKRVMRAAHREHRGARREALIENIDLRARITAELKREQAEQHRFSGTRRSDDHHMPAVADMRGQAARRRAACLGIRSEEHTSEL